MKKHSKHRAHHTSYFSFPKLLILLSAFCVFASLSPGAIYRAIERGGVYEAAGGVRIERVVPDSPAEAAGLLPGDVVTHINGQAILTNQDFPRLLYAYRAKPVALSVTRENVMLMLEGIPNTSSASDEGVFGAVYQINYQLVVMSAPQLIGYVVVRGFSGVDECVRGAQIGTCRDDSLRELALFTTGLLGLVAGLCLLRYKK